MSRSPIATPPQTTPTSSRICLTRTFRRQRRSYCAGQSNTHKPTSLYEAFPAPEARRLVEKFEWHYTPKHGSWLDTAESKLSVISGQCLDRRISNKLTLIEEVAAWEDSRNKKVSKPIGTSPPPMPA
jgi:hypothetical protein